MTEDRWRLKEWDAILRRDDDCFIAGCDSDDVDLRGPIALRDGSIHKACREHWEAIYGIVGRQRAWENDAGRWTPDGPGTFTCPVCGATSAHPTDAEEGYCGRCHDWTRRP